MFSVQQKRDISDAVQQVLRATAHAELPATGEISFTLHVDGAESWSFADIYNNGAVGDPGVNPHMPDPRATPDDFMKEMLKQQIASLNQRLFKAEAIIVNYNKRLNALEDFLTPIIEDNLIAHHSDQLNNLTTAIRQLGNAEINKTLKGD